MKNNINKHTKSQVKAHRCDFSGNSKGEVADVMVVWADRETWEDEGGNNLWKESAEKHVAYVELKKRSGVDEGNRKVVMSGSSDGQSGLEELQELVDESPPWTEQYVGFKFPNRELIVYEAAALLLELERENKSQHGARLTRGDNISLIKPKLSEWDSSTAGYDDWEKLCRRMYMDESHFTN